MPAHRRVRLGIARTFQKIRLFKQLSVLDNVVAGFHIHHDIPAWQYLVHGLLPARPCALPRGSAALLEFVGLTRAPATCLRVRCLMASNACSSSRARSPPRPQLLLIDEPAAGLNAAEVDSLARPHPTTRDRGMTVIVVEHNMDL